MWKGIDYEAVDQLVDWYIASGCVGIFCPCLSSEMFDLSNNERLELAKRVHRKANGRVVTIATGTYGGAIETQAQFINAMSQYCDAVVIVTSLICEQSDNDEVWKQRVSKLIDLTPNVKLGLYECPVPYKRLLSIATLQWCLQTNRFFFHKDTCW